MDSTMAIKLLFDQQDQLFRNNSGHLFITDLKLRCAVLSRHKVFEYYDSMHVNSSRCHEINTFHNPFMRRKRALFVFGDSTSIVSGVTRKIGGVAYNCHYCDSLNDPISSQYAQLCWAPVGGCRDTQYYADIIHLIKYYCPGHPGRLGDYCDMLIIGSCNGWRENIYNYSAADSVVETDRKFQHLVDLLQVTNNCFF